MSPATAGRFLDLRALAALSRLRFAPRRRIDGSYSGKHQSRAQGGAGEFVDYREYASGEDLRRLDWKILARTGRAYLRLFQEETNLVCTLVVDASSSMRFGDSPQTARLSGVQTRICSTTRLFARSFNRPAARPGRPRRRVRRLGRLRAARRHSRPRRTAARRDRGFAGLTGDAAGPGPARALSPPRPARRALDHERLPGR